MELTLPEMDTKIGDAFRDCAVLLQSLGASKERIVETMVKVMCGAAKAGAMNPEPVVRRV